MDPSLYEAAIEGRIHPFQNCLIPLNQILTPNENTILHVHLTNRYENLDTNFVSRILDMCPALLWQRNIVGETPLHTAAGYGQYDAVGILINRARAVNEDPEIHAAALQQMLRSTTRGERETALHKAARNNHGNVVRLLIQDDRHFSYPANNCGETPIYIAAVKGYSSIVAEMLDHCTAIDYGGPDGRSAMHAAVISNNEEIVNRLMETENNLIKQTDSNGWSPLHYAAYYGSENLATLLLRSDASVAYIEDKDWNRTAFHMAAMQGKTTVMNQFQTLCSDCHEQVDNRGWNALHYAVLANNNEKALTESVAIDERLGGLLNKKDNQGNTPLHLFAASNGFLPWYMWKETFKSIVDIHVLNNQNLSIGDILSGKFPEKKKEIMKSVNDIRSTPVPATKFDTDPWDQRRIDEKAQKLVKGRIEKAGNSHPVAATLIATVTFAAAFTLPGGLKSDDPNKGTAFFIKNAAFIIFILADAVAMALSTFAVFMHCLIPWYDTEDWETLFILYEGSNFLIMGAVVGMAIAFAAGTYPVLHTSLWLVIIICLIMGYYLVPLVVSLRGDASRPSTGLMKEVFSRDAATIVTRVESNKYFFWTSSFLASLWET